MQVKQRYKVLWVLTLLLSTGPGCGSQTKQACNDECSPDQRRCSASGNGYEVCGDYDDDSCLEWGGLVECSDLETCSNGECTSEQTGTKGLVLTGRVVPAGAVMEAGGLQLYGVITKDFGDQEVTSGKFTLEHAGFASFRSGE